MYRDGKWTFGSDSESDEDDDEDDDASLSRGWLWKWGCWLVLVAEVKVELLQEVDLKVEEDLELFFYTNQSSIFIKI